MSKQTIKEAIAKNLAGQGNQIDISGQLPAILGAMVDEMPEPQVQADWNQSDNTKPDYIKNKPVVAKAPLHVVVTLIPRAVENPDEPGETINVIDEAASTVVETTGQTVEYGDVVIVDFVISIDWLIGDMTICGIDPVDFDAAKGPYRLEVNHREYYDGGDGGIVSAFGIADGAAALSPLFIVVKAEYDGEIHSARFFIDGSFDLVEE